MASRGRASRWPAPPGYRVYATARTEAKQQLARDLGAHEAFASGARLPERVDAVMETVGEATWSHSAKSLKPGGRIVISGATSGFNPPAELNRFFFLQLEVVGSTMGTKAELQRPDRLPARHRAAATHRPGDPDRAGRRRAGRDGVRRAVRQDRSRDVKTGSVTAVVCAAFDVTTDDAVYAVRERVRALGVPLPDRPPHRPHFSLSAARVPRAELAAVVDVAAEVAARHEPVAVTLSEVGRFDPAGALWLGPSANRGLTELHAAGYAALRHAGLPPAFGERSAPGHWVPHCTLATRVATPRLRELHAALASEYQPVRGIVDALAVILVGGQGDLAHLPLGPSAADARITP